MQKLWHKKVNGTERLAHMWFSIFMHFNIINDKSSVSYSFEEEMLIVYSIQCMYIFPLCAHKWLLHQDSRSAFFVYYYYIIDFKQLT